eukprot:m.89715 g.89715  ORF g.89715 m.89715 type:complete len:372 (+) comp21541_c0_seq1:519-1634(+)
MKLANVSYTWGREPMSQYNESVAGVLPEPTAVGYPYGKTAQFKYPLDPFKRPGPNSSDNLLPGVLPASALGPVGSGDKKIGAYDFRVTLCLDKENQVPIPVPADYDPEEFELLRRYIKVEPKYSPGPGHGCLPNDKTDWKIGGGPISGEYVGGNYGWPDGNLTEQARIYQDHKRYALSLLHFISTDPVVPANVRAQLNSAGLCKDEYNRTADHFMPLMYVREGLRMLGEYVMTERDLFVNFTKFDVIGLGSYSVDIPGAVSRFYDEDHTKWVLNEGSMQSPTLCNHTIPAYAIPYRSLLPQKAQADNLLVSIAVSSSHVAFNALRMEPQFMIMGVAAGVAAALARDTQVAVQDVNIDVLQEKLQALGQKLE